MIELFFAISAGLAFFFLIVHVICFYYLEISNDYESLPFLKFQLDVLLYYNKEVKRKDLCIKNVCNMTLKVGAIGFGISIVFLTILNLMK